MKRPLICLVSTFLSCLYLPTLLAQSPSAGSTPLPQDPKDYMLLASRQNGLGFSAMQPWHLKASYHTLNEAGDTAEAGTFEEWWVAPQIYKISFSTRNSNQTQYRNGSDIRVTGSKSLASRIEQPIEEEIATPLPTEEVLKHASFKRSEAKFNQVALDCILTNGTRAYCFAPEVPAIRLEASSIPIPVQVIHNDFLRAGTQYIAKQITWVNNGKPVMDMKIDTLDYPAQLQAADIQAPADAAAPEEIALRAGMPNLKKVHNEAPVYPAMAKAAHISGEVDINATIEKDGTVSAIDVVSGPQMLREAAMETVRRWRYEPYLVDGLPVRVRTELGVMFTMAR